MNPENDITDCPAGSTTTGENGRRKRRPTSLAVRPSLFWDINPDLLDPDQHAAFIITRIMDRGTKDDVLAAFHHYGESTIKEHLLNARSLDKKTISYFANKFHVSRTQFRSYNDRTREQTWP